LNLFESFDQYLHYPREQAYNLFLDVKNLKTFKVMLNVFILIYAITFTVNLATYETFNFALILNFVLLVILVFVRFFYSKYFKTENIRKSIFAFMIFVLLLSISIKVFYPVDPDENEAKQKDKKEQTVQPKEKTNQDGLTINVNTSDNKSLVEFFFMFSILVLIFRFSRQEIIQLLVIGLSITLIIMFVLKSEFSPDNIIPNSIMGLMMFTIAYTTERKRQKRFYEQYDFQYNKNFENLRMKKELDYAREIQLSMLPENEAVIGDIEIAALSVPASEVGGDYFDYFKISENEIGIFICDVSGHGVASGLLLSGLRSCMHLILEDNTNPSIIIEKLNRMIRKTQNRKMFVTAIFAIIDTEKNKCILYNAGHLPPYKISGESKEIFKIKKHGIALGAMSLSAPLGSDNEVTIDFKKNDKLIFYTDGINEAMNSKKEEYGLDNLEFYLNNNADKKANELLNGLVADVKKFTGDSYQRDDITLLIIQRN
jgi:serine phosphatase RsbU (regulator of sigma subunit)